MMDRTDIIVSSLIYFPVDVAKIVDEYDFFISGEVDVELKFHRVNNIYVLTNNYVVGVNSDNELIVWDTVTGEDLYIIDPQYTFDRYSIKNSLSIHHVISLKNGNFVVFYDTRTIIYNSGTIIFSFNNEFSLGDSINSKRQKILKDTDSETSIVIIKDKHMNIFSYNFETKLHDAYYFKSEYDIDSLHIFSDNKFLIHSENKSNICNYSFGKELILEKFIFKNGDYIDFKCDAKISDTEIILAGKYLNDGYIIIMDSNTLEIINQFFTDRYYVINIHTISKNKILMYSGGGLFERNYLETWDIQTGEIDEVLSEDIGFYTVFSNKHVGIINTISMRDINILDILTDKEYEFTLSNSNEPGSNVKNIYALNDGRLLSLFYNSIKIYK